MSQTTVTPKTYLAIFAALLVLLVVTVAAAFVDLSRWLPGRGWGICLALTIAGVKAILIALYFMHLRIERARIVMFAGAGVLWLGVMLVLTMSDYFTRNTPPNSNPKGEPRYLEPISRMAGNDSAR